MNFLLIMVLILQWNANSVKAHGHELKNTINEWTNKPDILRIQETWLQPEKSFFLSRYDFHRNTTKAVDVAYLPKRAWLQSMILHVINLH